MKQLTQQEMDLLLDKAQEARDHSYAPYSKYNVGAALMTADGQIYQGCNIENAGFTPTVCAERTAFFKAVYDGHRAFRAIAVIATGEEMGFPCGVCRQAFLEFEKNGHPIELILAGKEKIYVIDSFKDTMPLSFTEF